MRFADPVANIEKFRLEPGMSVADFGAGSGAYTLAAAHVIGRRGVVYAIEIQQDLLPRIQNSAHQQELENVEVVWGDVEMPRGSKLSDASIDAIIISNALFLFEDKEAVALEAKRILKRNGKVLVIDWKDSFSGLGPQQDSVVPAQEAKTIFTNHGFVVDREIESGAHHYGIIFKLS